MDKFFDLKLPYLKPVRLSHHASEPLNKLNSLGIHDLKDCGRSYKNALQKIALFFKREKGYDFVQYTADEVLDSNIKAFIFISERNYELDSIYGGCCFRKRKYKDGGISWALQWIWIHPYEREKGHFKKAFPLFKDLLGEFEIEGPYSRPMWNFVSKYVPWIKLPKYKAWEDIQ